MVLSSPGLLEIFNHLCFIDRANLVLLPQMRQKPGLPSVVRWRSQAAMMTVAVSDLCQSLGANIFDLFYDLLSISFIRFLSAAA
jgi:hypothetical protein